MSSSTVPIWPTLPQGGTLLQPAHANAPEATPGRRGDAGELCPARVCTPGRAVLTPAWEASRLSMSTIVIPARGVNPRSLALRPEPAPSALSGWGVAR